jgi:hypothetical protein
MAAINVIIIITLVSWYFDTFSNQAIRNRVRRDLAQRAAAVTRAEAKAREEKEHLVADPVVFKQEQAQLKPLSPSDRALGVFIAIIVVAAVALHR